MIRTVCLCLCLFVTAASAAEPQFTAALGLKVVSNKETMQLSTALMGDVGRVLETTVAGKGGTTCDVKIAEVPGSIPRQYQVEVRLKHGKEVLSAPKIVALVGQGAQVMVGDAAGDHIRIDVVITE